MDRRAPTGRPPRLQGLSSDEVAADDGRVSVLSTRLPRPLPRPAVTAALAVCVLAAAIAVIHQPPAEHLSKPAATAFALRNQSVRERLVELGWNRVRTTPIDDDLERVTFFKGSRVVLEVAVARDGRVAATIVHRPGAARLGGEVAQRPAVLALLVAVFCIALASTP